jgi:hypothetical protein
MLITKEFNIILAKQPFEQALIRQSEKKGNEYAL